MKGGGLDCSKLGDEGYQVEGKGAWMKVAAFKDVWIDKKIREETRVGKDLNGNTYLETLKQTLINSFMAWILRVYKITLLVFSNNC